MQEAYGRAEVDSEEEGWLEVTAAMQTRLLAEEGRVPPERMAAALWLLRSAAQLWPDDAELRQISTWVRHNRAAAGSLQVGDAAPDLPLHSIGLPESPAATSSVLRACDGKPTLLVAGSLT